MKMRTITLAVALAVSATMTTAGGLANQIVESTPQSGEVAAAGPSINPTYIALGVLVALLLVAASGDGSNDTTTTVGDEKPPV